jgi:hypothetical protein
MRNKNVVSVMSILATVNAIAFALVFFGAAQCEGGDGCLAFSLLLLITFCVGVLILSVSAVAWAIARKTEVISNYFFVANLILFVFTVATVGMSISYVQ